MDKRVEEIAKANGLEYVKKKLLEEAIELAEAVSKYMNGKGTLSHLIEEIADVKLVTDQFEYFINGTKAFYEYKIKRTMEVLGLNEKE